MPTVSRIRLYWICQIGWPTPALVGADGVSATFFIVQHAAPPTQQQILPLVEAAWRDGDLEGQHYALLLDRVLVGRGELQVYGTHPTQAPDGSFVTPATVDDATLDARRTEVGLPPMAVYLDMTQQMYQASASE